MASFPAEGTMEQYVDIPEGAPRLLFLQPIAEGPYARALKKRGPGLHHIGAKTASLQALIPRLSEQGLFLHPISIQTLTQGVAWLCRPGLPFLIELSEGEAFAEHKTGDAFELDLPRNSQSPSQIPDFAKQIFANLRIQANAEDALSLKAGNNLIRIPQR
ncbi:MAG: hypothetical protein IV090_10530 [Candidatus Sericytochromatia bacterium]|nr:hypothetical protein [Candidatus Sericytochromatia bacterium]